MRSFYLLITGLLLLIFPYDASSQNFYSISLDGGYKYTEINGAGINGGINIAISNFYFSVDPLNATIAPKGDRYEKRNTAGWDYCVDTNQADIVDQSNCSKRFRTKFGYSADINYLLKSKHFLLALGAGYRLGQASTPYFNADFIFESNPTNSGHYWYGSFSAGKQFFNLGLGIAFTLNK